MKILKKGEHLFKEGDRLSSLFIIQSGLVSVYLPRPKKNIEIFQASVSQLLGEEVLLTSPQITYSAVAINETSVVEVPLEVAKQQFAASPQLVKLLFKGLSEKTRITNNELKSFKLERDVTPCPPDNVAKVFGVIYHVAKYTGTAAKDNRTSVNWVNFKRYAQRVFLESPIRLEQAVYLLVKLKLAELEMTKDPTKPEAPEEIGSVHFSNLPAIEAFFEFFQNYHFRGGSSAILRYDERSAQAVKALLAITANEPMDRNGVMYLNYKDTIDRLKEALGSNFTGEQLERLEQRGLFFKRESSDKGGRLSLYRSEFETMLRNWTIIREIEKWNDRGFVDMNDDKKPSMFAATKQCPGCSSDIVAGQKFCGNCGAKLIQEAA